jgi:chromosome segregation ATPase
MTDDLTPDDLAGIEARAKAATDEVVRLCIPGERWRMTVPVNEKRDSDTVLTAPLMDVRVLIRALREAREERDRMDAIAEDWFENRKTWVEECDHLREQVEAMRGAAEDWYQAFNNMSDRTTRAEAERDHLKTQVEKAKMWAANRRLTLNGDPWNPTTARERSALDDLASVLNPTEPREE